MSTDTQEDLALACDVVGDGEPILFISGLNDTREGWAENVPAFEGYRRITFDNRDVGESPRVIGPYTVADMAADALSILNRLGIERAHVVGHSMGGAIAQELALLAPVRVRSLVLVGTFARVDAYTDALFDSWKRMRRRLPVEDFARAAIFSWCGSTTIESVGMEELLGFVVPVVAAQEIEAFTRQVDSMAPRDRRPMLGSISAPTLVVQGVEDTTVRLAAARELSDGIPGAQLKLVEGAGHGPLFEQPEIFNAAVLEFIRSVD